MLSKIILIRVCVSARYGTEAEITRQPKYRVGAAAALVHLGGSDHAVLVAHRHHLVHVVGVVHHEGREVLYVDADVRPLLHLESGEFNLINN